MLFAPEESKPLYVLLLTHQNCDFSSGYGNLVQLPWFCLQIQRDVSGHYRGMQEDLGIWREEDT